MSNQLAGLQANVINQGLQVSSLDSNLTKRIVAVEGKQHMTCVILNHGTGGCNGDKKHYCFHCELNYELNSGLKQR